MTITTIQGLTIPDSKLAHEVTELVHDTESLCCFTIPAGSIISEL